jgi:transcription initiation factor TFIIIB Brf1 subunit/transcription initiation factor TFIIB
VDNKARLRSWSQGKLRLQVERVSGHLGLQSVILSQAQQLLDSVAGELYGQGKMPGDLLAASALYLAVRLAGLPFTLNDFAGAVGRDVFTVGRSYRRVAQAAGVVVPSAHAEVFVRGAASRLAGLGGLQAWGHWDPLKWVPYKPI